MLHLGRIRSSPRLPGALRWIEVGDADFKFPDALKDAELRQVDNRGSWHAAVTYALRWGTPLSENLRRASIFLHG